MTKNIQKAAALLGGLLFSLAAFAQNNDLRVVLIRHAEKPPVGYNLTCQGINRSLQLVPLLHQRFGEPSAIYVPAMGQGDTTKHARMFQTIVPFAARYNLLVHTTFKEDDTIRLAQTLRQQKGIVLLVWEHSRLPSIAHCLGVQDAGLHWPDQDYDSIWMIEYHNGVAVLKKDKEGLHPAEACPE